MKISILTPNYNGARWLARGMDSVLSQELAPGDELEYIFLDGGSTDDSLQIAEARRRQLALQARRHDRKQDRRRALDQTVGARGQDRHWRLPQLAVAQALGKNAEGRS